MIDTAGENVSKSINTITKTDTVIFVIFTIQRRMVFLFSDVYNSICLTHHCVKIIKKLSILENMFPPIC